MVKAIKLLHKTVQKEVLKLPYYDKTRHFLPFPLCPLRQNRLFLAFKTMVPFVRKFQGVNREKRSWDFRFMQEQKNRPALPSGNLKQCENYN